MLQKFSLFAIALVLALLSTSKASEDFNTSAAIETEKTLPKRSLSAAIIGDSGAGFSASALAGHPWAVTGARFSGGFGGSGSFGGWNTQHSSHLLGAPSPSEVANSIAAAKHASANVLIAQQQMQAAKENVLNQQRIAMEKETAAAILTQKSEAAAAIQRSEASSAAQAVLLAQQRLAASKSAVAHQQRIAAAREAEAAAALQRSAHAAAAEIQKTEYEAAKLGQLSRNNNAGATHHLTLTKDAAFIPITAGSNHIPNLESFGPWTTTSDTSGSKSSAWL